MTREQTRQRWQRHVDALAVSGMSAVQYAQKKGISLESLYSWNKKLKPITTHPVIKTYAWKPTVSDPVTVVCGRVEVRTTMDKLKEVVNILSA